MKKYLILTLILVNNAFADNQDSKTSENNNSSECEVIKPSLESVSEYLLIIANSLIAVKKQGEFFVNFRSNKNKDAADIMLAMKESKSGFLCLANMTGSYRKSKNKYISESSDSMFRSYQSFANAMDNTLKDFKESLDGKNKLSPGERADKDSEDVLKTRKRWEQVIDAIDLVTSAVVEKLDNKTNTRRFIITKAERDRIVKVLKSEFKLPIKGEMTILDQAANYYYDFLTKRVTFK